LEFLAGFSYVLKRALCNWIWLFYILFSAECQDKSFEISEKVQKSLITSLPTGRQGLGTDDTDTKCIEK
jgi:hypothetical protein